MFENMLYSYSNVIQIIAYTSALIGFYYKMRVEMKELIVRIQTIEIDRKEKWETYSRKQEKQDECLSEIMKALSEVAGDVKTIKTDIDWLKKK